MRLSEMKIYIVTNNFNDYSSVKETFKPIKSVEVVLSDFVLFMEGHPEVETIVSPANCYGVMDGGYDAAISNYLGWSFQKKVQQYIIENYYGEQIVGTSFIIDAPKNKRLIHTPTMIQPSIIKDDKVVYAAMRSTLMCALNNNVEQIVIPVFGTATGLVYPMKAASQMFKAYMQILNAEKGNYFYYSQNHY